MTTNNLLLERITVNPNICHGKPTVRNMRYPITFILDLLSSGMSPADILEDYPALELQDITACLMYASRLASVATITKIAA